MVTPPRPVRYRGVDQGPVITSSNMNEMIEVVTNANGTPTSKKISIGSIADKIWAQLYARPVLVACLHCNSGNAFDNGNCIQCGAPLIK